MQPQLKFLTDIKPSEFIILMNNPRLREHMPLLKGNFDQIACRRFLDSKQLLWQEHGYGPWAIVVDNKLAGWGGIQPEDGEADIALVLHPDYWGYGAMLFREFIHYARKPLKLHSVTALLPKSRGRGRALQRFGFEFDGTLEIDSIEFTRYRLRLDTKT